MPYECWLLQAAGNRCDLAGKTQSVPVKMEGGRIEFKPPFDPPAFVFEGNKLIATLDGRVDVWEKVP